MLYAKVIVNPAAGGYSAYREWPDVSRWLREADLSFDYEYTEGTGHAIELARGWADAGYQYVIAVGGDGTVNEVANGILRSSNARNTILGVVSAGTACNLARSLGIPQDYPSVCSLLTSQRRALIDVGLVEYQSRGKSWQRFFLNEADVGFGASVVEVMRNLPKGFGKTGNYALYTVGALRSAFSYCNKSVTLRVENREENILLSLMVVANGAYFAGGMYLAPQARVDDGLLDVVIAKDIEKFELLEILPRLYRGSHITHPKITVKKVTDVTIESPERVLVEADGELLGECPASFRVVPSALNIVR